MKAGYARVSTAEQSLNLQKDVAGASGWVHVSEVVVEERLLAWDEGGFERAATEIAAGAGSVFGATAEHRRPLAR